MKIYKVKYTLNENLCWSRVEARNPQEAAEKVYRQISEAYPDEEYEYMDVESDFDDGGVRADDSFIEDGNEYTFIARVGDVVHLDFDNWAVWAARNEDTGEINFFIVDEDTGFIDWGPVDSAQEATEFLQSKIADWENEDDNIDDLEYSMFESKGSISALEQELVSTVQKVMTSPEFGFDEEEAKAYSAVEVKKESDRVKVEVRAEVGYDAMWTMKDACDPIVKKYDSEAYFDFEQPGIIDAYIDAKNLTEDIDVVSEEPSAAPIEEGPQAGLASVVNSLIVDEYEAIDGYTSAIATARAEGYEDVAKVLEDISSEESVHVGQLQEIMKLFDPGAVKVDDGAAEAAEQLNNLDDEI